MARRRIMLDGYNLGFERGTGVATYGRNLSHRLKALGHHVDVVYGVKADEARDPLMSEVAFFDPGRRGMSTAATIRRLARSPFGLRPWRVPVTGAVITKGFGQRMPACDRIFNYRDLYEFSRWHFRVWRGPLPIAYEGGADIAHWTYPVPVRLKGAANIYTVHDLVPLRLPFTTLDDKLFHHRLLADVCRRADHIVTVSEASRRDIVSLYGVPEDRVTNTWQSSAPPPEALGRDRGAVADEIAAVFGLDFKDYFLFFGAIEPKKNVARIVEGFLKAQVDRPLVLVGSVSWKDAEDLALLGAHLGQTVTRHPIPGLEGRNSGPEPGITTIVAGRARVLRMEYLPFHLLTSLIQGARSVVFPSIYEGFGLPIVEAMQLGTAVITSREGSNGEIAGEAARLVDAYDADDIAAAIRELAADDDLVAHLETTGRDRAAFFSPERYDERLTALYDRIG